MEHTSIVYRHRRITRISHWAFALAFFVAAASGALIFFHVRGLPMSPKAAHLAVAYSMLGIALLYALDVIVKKGFRRLHVTRQELPKLLPMLAAAMRLQHVHAPGGAYNTLQKTAYITVLLVLIPLLALTGLALWPHAPFAHPIAAFFGGRAVKWWHIGAAIALLGFVGGHVTMVAATGLRNNVRSMLTGWYEIETKRHDLAA
jgi:thiosulfate reductase cytochrome b subunit